MSRELSQSYWAKHRYIRKMLPKPKNCQSCNVKKDYLDLAFKNHSVGMDTPELYSSNINDWYYICRKCHVQYDGRSKMVKYRNCKCGKKLLYNQFGTFHIGGGKACEEIIPRRKKDIHSQEKNSVVCTKITDSFNTPDTRKGCQRIIMNHRLRPKCGDGVIQPDNIVLCKDCKTLQETK